MSPRRQASACSASATSPFTARTRPGPRWLRNIQNPHEVYELLRKRLKARKDFGLMFREEM